MKNRLVFILFILFSVSVLAQKPKLGVLEFEIRTDKVKGISSHLYSYLQKRVRELVSDKYEIIVPPNLNLEDMYMMFACEGPTEPCMVSIANAIKVRYLIYGTISYQNGKYELILRMLDAKKKKVVKRGRLLGNLSSKDAMNENIDKALMRMFDIKGIEIRFLSVKTDLPADVYIDGKKIGKTPIVLTNKDIKPGDYKLLIKKDGYEPMEKNIVLSENRIETIDIKLKPVVIPALKKENKNKIAIKKDDELNLKEKTNSEKKKAWYKEYWVWGVAGVVVTATVITLIVMSGDESNEPSYNVEISF